MKHATTTALDQLDALLNQLRVLPGLKERSRGVFYRRSQAFLHFHEDPAGLFADLRDQTGKDFDRYDVTVATGQATLLDAVQTRLTD